MPANEPTHGDILVQLGELKGQVATLITLVGQKREDINAAFSRIGVLEKTSASRDDVDHMVAANRESISQAEKRITSLEKEIAKWTGVCLAASFSLPLLIKFLPPIATRAVHELPAVEHRLAP